jgi:hypothetical protein
VIVQESVKNSIKNEPPTALYENSVLFYQYLIISGRASHDIT